MVPFDNIRTDLGRKGRGRKAFLWTTVVEQFHLPARRDNGREGPRPAKKCCRVISSRVFVRLETKTPTPGDIWRRPCLLRWYNRERFSSPLGSHVCQFLVAAISRQNSATIVLTVSYCCRTDQIFVRLAVNEARTISGRNIYGRRLSLSGKV